MAGLTARSTATQWVVPGAVAAALHALGLCIGVFNTQPEYTRPTPAIELSVEFVEFALEVEEAASPATSAPTASAPAPKTNVPATHARNRSRVSAATAAQARAANSTSASQAATDAPESAAAVAQSEVSAAADTVAMPPSAVSKSPFAAAALQSTAGLATKPRLLSSGAACQGVLHSTALSTPTKVTLVLQVGKDGGAAATAVRADSNAKIPGLEMAAQRCAQRLRFSPARTADGAAVSASSVVKLTFSNHYTATLPRLTNARHGAI